jgi:uncharacterized membrane protein
MTLKQYNVFRIIIVIALAMSISISITLENYYLPIILMAIALAIIYYLRQQLKAGEVMADERDYKLAGDAARYTITAYGLVGVMGMFVLMALAENKESLIYALSQYLAFSICFLFLLNAFIFKLLSRKK